MQFSRRSMLKSFASLLAAPAIARGFPSPAVAATVEHVPSSIETNQRLVFSAIDVFPTNPCVGDLVFNNSNSQMYVYVDSNWVPLSDDGPEPKTIVVTTPPCKYCGTHVGSSHTNCPNCGAPC